MCVGRLRVTVREQGRALQYPCNQNISCKLAQGDKQNVRNFRFSLGLELSYECGEVSQNSVTRQSVIRAGGRHVIPCFHRNCYIYNI